MRAAVFSDVHGNLAALDAVLTDAEGAGADEYWVVGDLVANGPDPDATVRRLMGLSSTRLVRGNTDRYVLTGDLPAIMPSAETARSSAEVQALVEASSAFAWTRGAVTAAGAYDWLASLPIEHRVTLPDGSQVLLVHASPGQDDGRGVQGDMSDQELCSAGVADAGADLIFVGHTHVPLDRTVGDVRVVNLGSVSLPVTSDRRAMWTLLTADRTGFTIERRFAEYSLQAVISALDRVHYPSADWLKAKFDAHQVEP